MTTLVPLRTYHLTPLLAQIVRLVPPLLTRPTYPVTRPPGNLAPLVPQQMAPLALHMAYPLTWPLAQVVSLTVCLVALPVYLMPSPPAYLTLQVVPLTWSRR